MTTIEKEMKKRNKAMIDLDIEYARSVCPDASSDYVLLSSLHKARYETKDIPDKYRHESRLWLIENNQKRMFGMEFSSDGSLPE